MNKDELLNFLAPCGLNCKKCIAFDDGEIKKHSKQLQRLLGNFDNFAKRFTGFNPVFSNYPEFKIMLETFAKGGCEGCRKGGCINKACNVTECVKSKKVDYCFECDEFPCDKSGFDENLKKRWIDANKRMMEITPTAFYYEIKDLPRYQ